LALKLPRIQFGPKPRKWDLFAIAVLVLGAVLAAINWRTARAQLPGVSPSSDFTSLVVLLQLAVCTASLLLLGKTAKEGTLWGNLAAVGGMFAGLGGVLLAAALWVAA
jgi:predicted Abi (CAAX) family protease